MRDIHLKKYVVLGHPDSEYCRIYLRKKDATKKCRRGRVKRALLNWMVGLFNFNRKEII